MAICGRDGRGRHIQLGLSQAELARRAGVSRDWVNSFEAGKPTVELMLVLRILEVLGLRLDVSGSADVPEPHPAGSTDLVAERVGRCPEPSDASSGDGELTAREVDVLRLIAAGQSNREIARTLFVSEATVRTHVNRIFAKTGSRDRSQALRYAYTHGYAEPE